MKDKSLIVKKENDASNSNQVSSLLPFGIENFAQNIKIDMKDELEKRRKSSVMQQWSTGKDMDFNECNLRSNIGNSQSLQPISKLGSEQQTLHSRLMDIKQNLNAEMAA